MNNHDSEEALFKGLFSLIEKCEEEKTVVNEEAEKRMLYVYREMRHILGGSVDMTYRPNYPIKSYGVITIRGRNITINNTKEFVRVVRYANSLEAIGSNTGNVEITLGFRGLVERGNDR